MSTLLERALAGEPLGIEVIDMHAHFGRCRFGTGDPSPQGMVRRMDRMGIRAMLCSHMRTLSPDVAYGNAEMLKAMREAPGRILGYIGVYPYEAARTGRDVEHWLSEGFVGLKCHNSNGCPYDDPGYERAYAIADERRLPVLFHTWGSEKEFAQLRNVVARHPNFPMLLAHAGCTNEPGYIKIAQECPSVYFELAYSAGPHGLVERLVQAVGVQRVIWGSDGTFFSQNHQLGRAVGAQLSEQDKAAILGGNARTLLDRARIQWKK
jgi:uncharacterized protein